MLRIRPVGDLLSQSHMQKAKSECLFVAIETLNVVLEALVVPPKLMVRCFPFIKYESLDERRGRLTTVFLDLL